MYKTTVKTLLKNFITNIFKSILLVYLFKRCLM